MSSHRAPPSGISLTKEDAAVAKGMIVRGDRQHDIAAWFGVNGGRIGEVASGEKFAEVIAAPLSSLPPPGPYLSGRDIAVLLAALAEAKVALNNAERVIRNNNYR